MLFFLSNLLFLFAYIDALLYIKQGNNNNNPDVKLSKIICMLVCLLNLSYFWLSEYCLFTLCLQLNYSENFDEAYQLVKDGKAWGILEMGPYFTPNLITR